MTKPNPFRFKTGPEVIRLAVMLYARYPLSLRKVEDLLHERGVEISHETVRFWWNRFGPLFAAEIRRKRVDRMLSLPHWRWQFARSEVSYWQKVSQSIGGKASTLTCVGSQYVGVANSTMHLAQSVFPMWGSLWGSQQNCRLSQ